MAGSKSGGPGGYERPRVTYAGRVHEPGVARDLGKVTAGVPLTMIHRPRLTDAAELVVHRQKSSPAAVRFRELQSRLDNAEPDAPRTVVVTSAGDGEGKSLVAMNLSLAYAARKGGDVILLEADLRKPSLGQWITPAPKIGLAELLGGRTDLAHVLLDLEDNPLQVLPAGQAQADPLDLLLSDEFEQLVEAMKVHFRRVVIDTPPIVPFTDADAVARFSDGVLVVARAGLTRRGPLQQAISSVTSAPVLGTVLNDATGRRTH